MNQSFRTLNDLIPVLVTNNNDPEKKGRIRSRPIDMDVSQVPEDKLPWGYPAGFGTAQGGGIGKTPHVNIIPGSMYMAQRMPDGSMVLLYPISKDVK